MCHSIPLPLFINLASSSLNTSQICKTLPGKCFCSLQMVINKKESTHTPLAVNCSIFSSHRLYFPVRIMGNYDRTWLTKSKTRYSKIITSRSKQGEWFLFPVYVTPLPLQASSSRARTCLHPNSSFIFHTIVLCWSQVSTVTEDHLGLLHSIIHKTLSYDKKGFAHFSVYIKNIKPN